MTEEQTIVRNNTKGRDYPSEAERLLGADQTAVGVQVNEQAWSKEKPDTGPEPDVKPPSVEHQEWSVTWRYATALFLTDILLAIASAAIGIVARGDGAGTSPPPTTTTSSSVADTPPPPRVDSGADFKAAFQQCSNGTVTWVIGGSDYYGGPSRGVTAPQPGYDTSWQPQMLLYCVDEIAERLKPLGVTVVTAPSQLPNYPHRVRYFTTQTLEQSAALQKYLQGEDNPSDGATSRAMIANTGFCVQPDTRCERDY